MKNKSLTKVTAILLLVTMIALAIVSGTFAKYTKEYAGDSTAVVAKWRVSVTDLDGNGFSDDKTFNIFDKSKVYDLASVDDINDLSAETGTAEDDVLEGTSNAIVAPGTWGKVAFKIAIDAENEVSVKYGINISQVTNGIGDALEFSNDGKNWKTSNSLTTLVSDTFNPGDEAVDKTVTLYWRWLYEDAANLETRDTNDTSLGSEETSATCVIKATFGATQVD